MQRKIKYKLLVFLTVLILTGCADKTAQPVNNGGEAIADINVNVSKEELKKAASECVNLEVADDVSIHVPEKIGSLVSFDLSYYPGSDSKEALTEFKGFVNYVFPEEGFGDENIFFVGDRYRNQLEQFSSDDMEAFLTEMNEKLNNGEISTDEFEKNINEFEINNRPTIPKVSDYLPEIESGKENVNYYYLDAKDKNGNRVFLEAQLPLGNGLFRINRGVAANYYYSKAGEDVPFPETLDALKAYVNPNKNRKMEYPPDSGEKIMLLEGEITIKEAVGFFEKYMEDIPLSKESPVKVKVVGVEAYELEENRWGLQFVCTSQYKDVEFDHANIITGDFITDGNTGIPVYMSGIMVKSGEVDTVYQLPRIPRILNEKGLGNMMDCTEALKNVSMELSEEVRFTLEKVEMVYFTERDISTPLDENSQLPTKPQWKFTLKNDNDNIRYVCYVNVSDGKGFHYYTMGV